MKYSLALALFASTALAAPHKRSNLADRVSRRRTTPPKFVPGPSKTVELANTGNTTQVDYSSNWAGAVLTAPPAGQTFTGVSAQFVVPNPQVPSGGSGSYSSSAWVGIDGDTYQNAILQTGVDFTADSSGGVSFDAWYEWFPDYAYDFSGISMNVGDTIAVSVSSSSASAGVATIENLSNGQTVTQNLNAPDGNSNLGGQNAEWIVEDFEEGSSEVPFANFGTVSFTSCQYTSSGGSGGVSGADVLDIRQNGQVLTSVSIPSDSEVDVSYQ
jgi:Peptidase A4 family